MFNLLGKLQEAKQQMEDVKKRMEGVEISGAAGDGAVKVTVTGARQVTNLDIAGHLLEPGKKEELEDLLLTALNRALKEAEEAWEKEMKGVAGGLLGGGLF
ncbi:YbaB/EbfC family nucleoid-associated protein [Compostibacter hankyongensis]|uniref:Nucleoid-associated protein GCM10023143_01650 n=1 Tax=Compostibacter hankyongensis TaxID=1007089 RepID=A0ABP8FCX7_9BACT